MVCLKRAWSCLKSSICSSIDWPSAQLLTRCGRHHTSPPVAADAADRLNLGDVPAVATAVAAAAPPVPELHASPGRGVRHTRGAPRGCVSPAAPPDVRGPPARESPLPPGNCLGRRTAFNVPGIPGLVGGGGGGGGCCCICCCCICCCCGGALKPPDAAAAVVGEVWAPPPLRIGLAPGERGGHTTAARRTRWQAFRPSSAAAAAAAARLFAKVRDKCNASPPRDGTADTASSAAPQAFFNATSADETSKPRGAFTSSIVLLLFCPDAAAAAAEATAAAAAASG